jgi:hypothetical protein
MQGRRLAKTEGVFAGIRGGLFRTENDGDACRSCAAGEWHDSDRLLLTERLPCFGQFTLKNGPNEVHSL